MRIHSHTGAEQFHCSARTRIELSVILVDGRVDANRRRFLISNDGRRASAASFLFRDCEMSVNACTVQPKRVQKYCTPAYLQTHRVEEGIVSVPHSFGCRGKHDDG